MSASDTPAPIHEGYTPSFDKPPFVFGALRASALPGPLLIELMSVLDQSEAANKAILHRMSARGLLSIERRGRVGVYRLAGRMLQEYRQTRSRSEPPPWNGSFHSLIYDIPETQRRRRDGFRALALRLGYRPLRPGILISPNDSWDALAEIAASLDVVRGQLVIDPAQVCATVLRCWALPGLRDDIERTLREVRALPGPASLSGPDALRLLHCLMRPATELRLRAGNLPRELLPRDWPQRELDAEVTRLFEALLPVMQPWLVAAFTSSPHAGLVEFENEPDFDQPKDP